MGLHYTGELLAVNIETVPGNAEKGYDSFTSVNIVLIDGATVTEARAGRDLPTADLNTLRNAPRGTMVDLDADMYKGRVYVNGIRHVEAPAKSA